MIDMRPRYAPSKVLIVHGNGWVDAPVIRYVVHPKGTDRPRCPIGPGYVALELVTDYGSRWFGCEEAYINSELRMVVVGTNTLDEVRMRWPLADV